MMIGYKMLASSIIYQAVEDYKKNIITDSKIPNELIEFFESDYFDDLADVSELNMTGEQVIDVLKGRL